MRLELPNINKLKQKSSVLKMVSKSTHVYKTVGSLEIQLDIYTRDADLASKRYKNDTPVVLFFHGGGLVAHDRRLLPPHFVQSALGRGWPLISADHRLAPQANGLDILDDMKDAYKFVLEKLPGILNAGTGPMKNVIVTGCSAGKTFDPKRLFSLIE
jgi:acetyl esterase/lipase